MFPHLNLQDFSLLIYFLGSIIRLLKISGNGTRLRTFTWSPLDFIHYLWWKTTSLSLGHHLIIHFLLYLLEDHDWGLQYTTLYTQILDFWSLRWQWVIFDEVPRLMMQRLYMMWPCSRDKTIPVRLMFMVSVNRAWATDDDEIESADNTGFLTKGLSSSPGGRPKTRNPPLDRQSIGTVYNTNQI